MKKRKDKELFSMSFLDIMACGFGALVLILLISKFQDLEIIIFENDAYKLIELNNEKKAKIKKSESVDKIINDKIDNLLTLNNELDDMNGKLAKRIIISSELGDLVNSTQSKISEKINSISSTDMQKEASGIRIDSKYLVFIIDNSASMIDSGPWSEILKEIDGIINTFPNLDGYIVLNDVGYTFHGGNPWLAPTKANRRTSLDLLKVNPYKYISASNPIPALKTAINKYGKKYNDVGVFIIGDDVQENKRMNTVLNDIKLLNTKADGSNYVRINAISFLTSKDELAYTQQNKNYLILMRELTEQSGGALVVVN
jgi:hypothetical protein